jgi:hypothetical protein
VTVTPRHAFLIALAAYFLLGSAWAMALPPNGTYDERHHIVKAYAVADGQILPGGPDRMNFDVPSTLLPPNPDCFWVNRQNPQPASCLAAPSDTGTVSTLTYAGRYNPVYYLPVGLPLLLWPDQTGIIFARIVSALLSALLLAAAVWIAARLGNRLLVAAVALVTTPMVVNLAGSVNPNGIEITAAVLLFVSLLALVSSALPRPALLTLAGIGAFVLLTVRHFGPVLLVVDVLAVAAVAGTGVVRVEVRRRDTWVRMGGWVVAGLAVAIAWAIAVRSPVGPGPGSPTDLTAGGVVRGLIEHRLEFYIRQIVGQFGYGETTISPLAVLVWYAVVAAMVLPALWRSAWRIRLVALGLVAAGLTMLVAFEFYFIRSQGWFSHGRYALPILVGAVLVPAWSTAGPAGSVARACSAGRASPWWLPVGLIAAITPVHVYALVRVMSRYQVGIKASLSPFEGTWHPSVGSYAPLLTLLVGCALLVASALVGLPFTRGEEKPTESPDSTRTVSAN